MGAAIPFGRNYLVSTEKGKFTRVEWISQSKAVVYGVGIDKELLKKPVHLTPYKYPDFDIYVEEEPGTTLR